LLRVEQALSSIKIRLVDVDIGFVEPSCVSYAALGEECGFGETCDGTKKGPANSEIRSRMGRGHHLSISLSGGKNLTRDLNDSESEAGKAQLENRDS
jgi:hypothetical protein